jgi:hypothetical protein
MRNTDQIRYQAAQDKTNRAAVNVAALVRVLSFDPNTMTVDVQPLSKYLEGGRWKTRPPTLGVPVAATANGGFVMRPWISAGDVGVVIYLDHDMDRVLETGRECVPNTERNHSIGDGVYIGGIVTANTPFKSIYPDNAFVIAADGGAASIALFKNNIRITGEVNVIGNLTINDINFNAHVHGDVQSGPSTTSPPQ